MQPNNDDLYVLDNNHSMKLTIRIADTFAQINIDGQNYNPDILDDATTRLTKLFATSLAIATANGYQFITEIQDEDDDA